MSRLSLKEKLNRLESYIESLGSVLVAYSGGVDSTFLLSVASRLLGKNVLAVTALSETYPAAELECATGLAKKLKVRQKLIRTSELKNPDFARNPINRCYYCKKELFSALSNIARKSDIKYVVDGSNVDDLADYRPGSKAKEEFGVLSPLQTAGLTKRDIRKLSHRIGLDTWCKPALACLASRIPYHSRISRRKLSRIDTAETALRKQFNIVGNLRVRDYGDCARLEVDKSELKKLRPDSSVKSLLEKFRYKEVMIDKKGYRTGSMNPARADRGE